MNIFRYFLAVGFFLYSSMVWSEGDATSVREFSGINFGVGISLTQDIGKRDRVISAVLDENGVLRISQDRNSVARIMLESHYFFKPDPSGKSFLSIAEPGAWGHGPFVAIQPGTDEIIEAMGLGWMVGFKRKGTGSESWNLGLGYVVDPNSKILGDGLTQNQPLPDGEAQVRFKETSQDGIFLIASFTF